MNPLIGKTVAGTSSCCRRRSEFGLKAKIIITPKKAVVDPQGKTVQSALAHMGYAGVGAVHVGKYLEIELAGADKETARKQIDDITNRLKDQPVQVQQRVLTWVLGALGVPGVAVSLPDGKRRLGGQHADREHRAAKERGDCRDEPGYPRAALQRHLHRANQHSNRDRDQDRKHEDHDRRRQPHGRHRSAKKHQAAGNVEHRWQQPRRKRRDRRK